MLLSRNEQIDVAVVGGGLAGLMAVIEAGQRGASVVLLEKRDQLGGSTAVTDGLFAFAGTDEQRAAEVDDDVESLRRDLVRAGNGYCDLELVDTYCREQLPMYQWMKGHGIKFGPPHPGSNQTKPRSHSVDTAQLIECLETEARQAGADIRTSAEVERLILEDEHVTGARIADGGSGTQIWARAVVLTTGGFSQNASLIERLVPHLKAARPAGAEGSMGDGLLMGWKIGAGVRDIPFIKGSFGVYPWGEGEVNGMLAVYKGAIAVNKQGERFADESWPYKVLGEQCLAQPEGIAFQIFDQKVLQLTDPDVPIYDIAERVASGQAMSAASIAELAAKAGLPGQALVRTVAAYNRGVAGAERDAFGRATLAGGVGKPTPIDSPPYFCFPSTTFLPGTYGGLWVTVDGSVLDVYGTLIHGLYAAGEVTGGFHGGGYMTGSALSKAAIFGRLTGRAAAEYALLASSQTQVTP
jgi:fumarate reductase flavoprotein subunit